MKNIFRNFIIILFLNTTAYAITDDELINAIEGWAVWPAVAKVCGFEIDHVNWQDSVLITIGSDKVSMALLDAYVEIFANKMLALQRENADEINLRCENAYAEGKQWNVFK